MHLTRPLQAGALALVLGTAAAAPLLAPTPPASDRLPKPSLETFRQTEATAFEDYAGRAVLIEFFEHWWGACRGQVRHLNKLQKEFGDKGLSVIGVASDDQDATDEWITKARAKYAYAFDPLGELMKSVGLTSYPSALLVDSSGRIVFGGYPGEIDDEMVEKAIRGALTEPIYQWPDALEDAADAMRAGKLGKAISKAEAAGEEHAEYADELVGLLDGRVDILEEAHEIGDYLAVIEMAEELEEAIDGREQEAKVQGLVSDITKNRDKRMVLEAQKDIAKMLSKKIKRKDVSKLVKKLEKLRAKHPGTIIDLEVDEAIEKLRAI